MFYILTTKPVEPLEYSQEASIRPQLLTAQVNNVVGRLSVALQVDSDSLALCETNT